jgi:DNA polymerase II small subunit/DNA polymerase delta subunit B
MPYERKGKCIYNKETGEKKGCSKTVGKAKSYMRALYAAEKGTVSEETSKRTQAVLDRAEDIYQAMKKSAGKKAVSRYGADAEDVLRGRAMNIAKKQVKMGNEEKLKEIIKKKLATPPSTDEALKGGQKKLDANKDGKISGEDFKMLQSMKEEVDYEGEMAKSELYRIIENAEELFQMLDDDTQLEGWVQSKITKAADYLNSVTQYLKYQSVKPNMTDERLDYTLDK